MKRYFVCSVIVLLALAAVAQAQTRTSVYFGVGVNSGPPAYGAFPRYPVVNYGPAYPVVSYPAMGYPAVVYRPCGPVCQQRRWERQRWLEHERREHFWRMRHHRPPYYRW